MDVENSAWGELNKQFNNKESICNGFAGRYLLSNLLILGIPLAIVFITYISQTFLRLITAFEKPQSEAEQMLSSAINMFLLSYINVGIVLFLVNFNLGSKSEILSKYKIPIFQGQFTTFSVQWYRLVGSTLCFTMLVYIGSTHASNFAYSMYLSTLRCWDRGCSMNRRRTRQVIQEDYEDKNIGERFEIEFRYASILFVLGITFLYSSGMPILYPIAAAFFVVGYWVDKILLLRFNRRPIQYDSYLSKKSLQWYKFILLMHVIFGTIMYANSSICPSRQVFMDTANKILEEAATGWKIRSFFQLHILMFLGLMALIAFIYLFWTLIVKSVTTCVRRSKEDED